MKRYLAITVLTVFFIVSCASVPVQEPRVPDFSPGYGTVASGQPEQPPSAPPVEEVETAAVPVEAAAEPEPEHVAAEPKKPAESVEPGAAEVSEEPAETPAEPAEKQEAAEEQEPVKTVQEEPEDAVSAAVKQESVQEKEAAPAPVEPSEPQEVVIYTEPETASEAAAKEVEDRDSTLFRAAWFGLPVLLLLLVILIVEIIRWFVYKKPLFGWAPAPAAAGYGNMEEVSERKPNRMTSFFGNIKAKISGRFSGFMDRLYKDLEEDDDEIES